MPVVHRTLANTYYDSVFLMGIAGRLGKQAGVRRTAALMATPKNKPVLEEFGVAPAGMERAGPTDLVLAVDAVDEAQGVAALAQVDHWLSAGADERAEATVTSLEAALLALPGAGLALISVPGDYAAFEARRAIAAGLHTMVFSDNVARDDEIALKRMGAERNVLVMGPDCGTAILGGVGLGFANVVRRGSIGVVGPSGTGIQHVASLIDAGGGGVSHAIGAGSHDLSDEVGGRTTLAALAALAADPTTAVIAIVAKPPGPETLARVLAWIAACPKPVVTCVLGPVAIAPVSERHVVTRTLAEAASAALRLAGVSAADEAEDVPPDLAMARQSLDPGQRYLRALFAGGTFCYEAQQILLEHGVRCASNTPIRPELAVVDALAPVGTALIDLGDDAFTRGRPHPMIDATLRNERIVAEAADPSVAALLLDFILGYGAASDPVGDAAPAIAEARRIAAAGGRRLPIIGFVCGTNADPQRRAAQVAHLQSLGVLVAPSSSAAARWAAGLLGSGLAGTQGSAEGTQAESAPVALPSVDSSSPGLQPVAGPRLPERPGVVALGVRLFTAALEAQGTPVVHVEWSPPAGGDPEMLDLLADLL